MMSATNDELLSLFLKTVDDYTRIAAQLPVSDGLKAFDFDSSHVMSALANFDRDRVAIEVRIMLQRKYFQNGEQLQLKKLVRVAEEENVLTADEAESFLDEVRSIHEVPIELVLSDGRTISTQFLNIEDIAYGTLLHGDIERVRRSLAYPTDMRLLSMADCVLKREEQLVALRDSCLSAGISPLGTTVTEKAPVLRQRVGDASNMRILSSPYWSNLIGNDANESDLRAIVERSGIEDNLAVLTAMVFFSLLLVDPLDASTLRQYTTRMSWLRFGDFRKAADVVKGIDHPGVSSRVLHEGGTNYAQVRVLPQVISPWITDTPQLIQAIGCIIEMKKSKGVWKVNGIALP